MPRRNNGTKHTTFHFASSCQTKRRFDTEKQAEATAQHQMLIKSDLILATYKCELCGGWHLTRQQR